MNWGHKITLSFIAFAAFIIYMVVGAFNRDIDLVTDDYYAKEIAYESKMRQKANYNQLVVKPEVVAHKDEVIIDFKELNVESGEIHFYHPSREIFDQNLDLNLDHEGKQKIDRKLLTAGLYRANLTWQAGGREYFHQQTIFIQ